MSPKEEIVLVRNDCERTDVAHSFPMPTVERAERVPTGVVIEHGDWRLGAVGLVVWAD